jgi:hypothetical protein
MAATIATGAITVIRATTGTTVIPVMTAIVATGIGIPIRDHWR